MNIYRPALIQSDLVNCFIQFSKKNQLMIKNNDLFVNQIFTCYLTNDHEFS